ncbi:hypothetical protein DFH11DRAFT_1702549 [Phellopilus nigrolimitatus]|nr:hypothetical protein DFH11DRAFT_1702549 [Phellopilus nigrolimitatus]
MFGLPPFDQEPINTQSPPPNPDGPRPIPCSPAKDTPIARTENGAKDGFDPKDAKSRNIRYAREMKRWCVGPMPVEEFLDEFLPPAPKGKGARAMPSCKGAFNRVPMVPKDEQAIYEKLIPAINYKKRCPSLNFVDTSTRSESSGLGSLRPDICAYDSSSLDVLERELMENPYTSDGKKRKIPAHFGYVELFIDVKKNEERDPFVDPLYEDDEGICSETNFFVQHESSKIRKKTEEDIGRIVSYAAEACARQHRMFYFSVSIHGHHARLIRWDRAGAVVSRSFNYRQNPELFCKFLWRFGHANPTQHGYDPTVAVASEKDEEDFKAAISAHVAFQLDVTGDELEEAVGRHYQKERVAKVDVVSGDHRGSPMIEQYLISRPVMSPSSVAGRSTRGYWAVKVGSLEMAFLKDAWRIDVDRMEQEGAILRHLNASGVKNISDLYCHGDVPIDIEDLREEILPQCTRTDEFVCAEWACNGGRKIRVTKHVHYRLLLKAVGYSLRDFKGTREMFEATQDAYEALIDAHEKCNRLHRDISLNNVILVRDPETGRRRGILIDWEVSTVADNGTARDYNRSGTWAFMSADALNPGAQFRHSIKDDMESMLYVVLYCCVRWLPHNKLGKLGQRMHMFFDQYDIEVDDTMVGGTNKNCEKVCRYFTRIFVFENVQTQTWITKAFNYLAPFGAAWPPFGATTPQDYKGKWTPKSFESLWTKICKEELPEDDRVVHDVSDVNEGKNDRYEGTLSTKAVLTRTEALIRGQKPNGKSAKSRAHHGPIGDNAVAVPSRHRQQELMIAEPGLSRKRKFHDTDDDPTEAIAAEASELPQNEPSRGRAEAQGEPNGKKPRRGRSKRVPGAAPERHSERLASKAKNDGVGIVTRSKSVPRRTSSHNAPSGQNGAAGRGIATRASTRLRKVSIKGQ